MNDELKEFSIRHCNYLEIDMEYVKINVEIEIENVEEVEKYRPKRVDIIFEVKAENSLYSK